MPSSERVLLDTHVLLWWVAEPRRLSAAARRAVDAAAELSISPATCWEVATLVRLERIELDRPTQAWINDVLREPRTQLAPLTPAVAVTAGELSGIHGDPADRMLVATAAAERIPLVTKDRRIRDFARTSGTLRIIW